VTRRDRLKTWCEGLYAEHGATIADLLGSPDVPVITVVVHRGGFAAAWTSGTEVHLNAGWFRSHADDVGGCLHEFAHAIMRAPIMDDDTGWLIEGIADWVRDELGFDAAWTKAHYEPGKALDGYQTTAHFLRWLRGRWPRVVRELSRRLAEGRYTPEDFETITRTPLAQLVQEYEASGR
jgi:Peptidase of plants and bacteria